MKIKFFAAILAIYLATNPFLSLAAESLKATETSSDVNISNIKTFDFERIFKEADAYFEAAQKWRTVKCIPKTMFVCAKHDCTKLKPIESTALVVDKDKKTLALCHNKICQYYSAKFEQTGVFINVEAKDVNGIFIRILGNSRFKEIAMIGLDSYITNGECELLE